MQFLSALIRNKWFWIAVAALIVVIIIYKWGKSTATGPQPVYPEGGKGIPAGWSPEPLAAELYNNMDGLFTLGSTKEASWKKLYDLPTLDMTVAVYSVFGQKYFNKGKGTLTDWIRDEVNYVPVWAGGIKENLLSKLTQNSMP